MAKKPTPPGKLPWNTQEYRDARYAVQQPRGEHRVKVGAQDAAARYLAEAEAARIRQIANSAPATGKGSLTESDPYIQKLMKLNPNQEFSVQDKRTGEWITFNKGKNQRPDRPGYQPPTVSRPPPTTTPTPTTAPGVRAPAGSRSIDRNMTPAEAMFNTEQANARAAWEKDVLTAQTRGLPVPAKPAIIGMNYARWQADKDAAANYVDPNAPTTYARDPVSAAYPQVVTPVPKVAIPFKPVAPAPVVTAPVVAKPPKVIPKTNPGLFPEKGKGKSTSRESMDGLGRRAAFGRDFAGQSGGNYSKKGLFDDGSM